MLIRAAALLLLFVSACKGDAAPDAGPVRVAAASDLGPAFEAFGRVFTAATGKQVAFTFGSSGQLAKQLAEGAPFDVFAAANIAYADDAARAGACRADSKKVYGRGHLVVWTPHGVPSPARFADLGDPRFGKIAIANPAHAPYGKAAQEALTAAGLWPAVEKRIVYGENVRQAFQMAQTGNVEAAIVAKSLTIDADGGVALGVDEALHAPLDQAIVVCTHGKSVAGGEEFVRLVASADGRALLQRYGFAASGGN